MYAFGSQYKHPVVDSPDLRRVLELPRRALPDEVTSTAMRDLMTARFAKQNNNCKCASMMRKCITRLRRAQAWALYEMGTVGGLLGSIGVGHGKTLLGLLAPLALKIPPKNIVVMLCPPGNVGEVIDEYEIAGEHFNLPSITVHGRTNYTRAVPGTPSLHVMPYSMLSRPENTAWIAKVRPLAIIVDETDKLKDLQTATTARVARHMQQFPETRFCAWTGSLTDKSIMEYAHLAGWALGDGSPLPRDPEVTKEWGRAIDASDCPAPGGKLLFMCERGEELRSGFQRRLRETPGMITTTKSAIATPLVIAEKQAPPTPKIIEGALRDLRNDMLRPDGVELVSGLEVAACAKQLACGFYYRWVFPRNEPRELIERWFEARKEWGAEMRAKMAPRLEGMDSIKLVTDAARRYWGDLEGPGPRWKSERWPAWRDLEPQVKPKTGDAVRLSDFLARDAAQWALQNKGIVWYSHKELGLWISELSGLPLHEGGSKARELILAEKGDRSIVASIDSHGRGRNGLQFRFSDQLITSMPSSGSRSEQLLGRLHRAGAEAEAIRALYYAHTEELQRAFAQAIARAVYVEQTMGQEQKILK